MNTHRIHIFLSAFACIVLSTHVAAEDFYTEITAINSNIKIASCESAEERVELMSSARKDLRCTSSSKPRKYKLIKTTAVGKDRYAISEVIDTETGQHRFIFRGELMPYTEHSSDCLSNSSGGQVNRLEAGKDGRLYMKKYMVSTICVNGKSKAVWKPLN
ncbi:hypothetical protein NJH78_05215 [Pseudomonas chlororaphis]|uniref:hypothetical protein n=1 Tax=Pseudomonas chlororaphis TaxID=587753 RepID=UPI00209B91E1|nr:hypothetical protein [Pseudomonas chlororaphis]MCO7569365.1 hypothetical protein [Pseudomonas chlororaphis]MCO7586790.1 hypothetical protein [Pseudomonas chlororaphis]